MTQPNDRDTPTEAGETLWESLRRALFGPGDHGLAIYWNGEPAPNWLARIVWWLG